jgi:RimJ/RimL family protein N-acetyltransferase
MRQALAMSTLTIRPLRAGERLPVLEVFEGLSDRSKRSRFLGAKPRLTESDVRQLVDVGCCGREAVVATDPTTGHSVGLARFVKDDGAPEAEVAFEVADAWQGNGIGRELLTELARKARRQGILRFRALTSHDNRAAIALMRGVGEVLSERRQGPELELVVRLR